MRSEYLVKFLEKERVLLKKSRYQLLSSIIGIIIFLFSYVIMVDCYMKECSKIPVSNFFSYSLLIIAMGYVQLLIGVFLVLINQRIGYIVTLILNIFALISTFIYDMIVGTTWEVQDIIFIICHLLVVSIVYIYVQLSEEKYKQVRNQQEQIINLYEENAASKVLLEEQKIQLERYNSILKEREKELNNLAYYDPLTGLSNRRKFLNHIDTILHGNVNHIEPFAVVFIDLDNFKGINDSAGHEVGDDVLQVISSRWKTVIMPDDLFARFGGDEFAVIFHNISQEYKIRSYIERLKEAMNEKIFLNHREFVIKASFGVAIYPKDGLTKEQLLKHADIAMYAAKSSQSNEIRFFNQSLKRQFQHTTAIGNSMQMIFEKKELSTVYQPQYYMQTGELRGFEVLARWKDGRMGQVSPKEFIPIAEENGMMIEMGEWILRQACRDCHEWMSWYQRKLILVVNVSCVQLLDQYFIEHLQKIMEDTQFNLTCLEIDVTEKKIGEIPDAVIDVLKQLQELGVSIAVDDFGTGSIPLSKMKSLPIDILKLDQGLIREIGKEKNQESFIESVVHFAHQLNIMVAAEGVERQEENEYLLNSGCDYVQGYLFGKPSNFDSICKLLESEVHETFISEKKGL